MTISPGSLPRPSFAKYGHSSPTTISPTPREISIRCVMEISFTPGKFSHRNGKIQNQKTAVNWRRSFWDSRRAVSDNAVHEDIQNKIGSRRSGTWGTKSTPRGRGRIPETWNSGQYGWVSWFNPLKKFQWPSMYTAYLTRSKLYFQDENNSKQPTFGVVKFSAQLWFSIEIVFTEIPLSFLEKSTTPFI